MQKDDTDGLSAMPRVSIIIVAYNNVDELPGCLNSIYKQDFRDWEILVVDNFSQDGSREFLIDEQKRTGLKLILNETNAGFCRANNQGIDASSGEYILFLNPDSALLGRDVLGKFINAMDRESNLASVTGKLFKDPDKKILDSTGLTFKKYSYIPFDRGEGEIDQGQYDKDEYIFGPSCACALYRRKALEEVKYNGQFFDEDFFAYFEDVDLAWRIKNRGWKAKYLPSYAVYHQRKGASVQDLKIKIIAFRNAYLAALKNAAWSDLISPLKLVYNLGSIIKNILMCPYKLFSLSGLIFLAPKTLEFKINFNKICVLYH